MISISPQSEQILSEMYDNFIYEIKTTGKNSVWEFIFNVKNNKRFETLYNAASRFIPIDVREELKTNGLARDSKDEGDLIITAFGIRYVELLRDIDSVDELISCIDNRFLTIEIKDVTPREKIVLFSIVMLRCFSEKCCIDARKDDYVKDYWMDIFLRAESKLQELGVIANSSIEDLGKKSDIEHPMSNIIRHTDSLDTKVKMLYKKTGKNQYYLDMIDSDGKIDIDNLSFIFGIIFGDKLNFETIDEISEFCNDSSLFDSSYVLDPDLENYSGSEYDEVMREAMERHINCSIRKSL